jgi:hypothetical protein
MKITEGVVATLARDHQCLSQNGLHYPNDTIALLRFDRPTGQDCVTASVKNTIAASQVTAGRENLFPLHTVAASDRRSVSCGESGWGSAGFVAMRNHQEELLWIAFFDFSNPFDRVEEQGRLVIARSTFGAIWTFDHDAPTRVVVTRGEVGWPADQFWGDTAAH